VANGFLKALAVWESFDTFRKGVCASACLTDVFECWSGTKGPGENNKCHKLRVSIPGQGTGTGAACLRR
jgi:hypothetical protein